MGGDGLSGLALAILAAGLAIVGGFGLLFFLVARTGSRSSAAGKEAPPPRARRPGRTILLTTLGLGVGCLVVTATFYESLWSPPPQLRLEVPPGYRDIRIFVLEDPRRGLPLTWLGGGFPFRARHATIAVPPSGIVRVRSLRPEQGRADLDVVWLPGDVAAMNGGGDGPPGTGAASYVILERTDAWANGPPAELPGSPEAIGALILARERGR